jgi:hypothetical protein
MRAQVYFANLKKAITGALVTDASAVIHRCADVFARNDSSNPLFVTLSGGFTLQNLADIHDAASVNINAVSGAYKALGAAITIPAGTDFIQVSSTLDEPCEIVFAANIGTIGAGSPRLYLVPGGAPGKLDFIPSTNNKAFVRSLSANPISSGYLALNCIG